MSRDKIRHVDLRPDEFIAGTFGQLTFEQFAVYWAVCLLIYSRGGEAPNDATYVSGFFRNDRLATRSQSAALALRTRRALDRLVSLGKLRLSPDGERLSNGRATVEISRAIRRLEAARQNGAQGGRPGRQGTRAQPAPNPRPATPPLRNINDLAKPGGSELLNPKKISSLSESLTDAAREPAPDQTAPARAHALPEPEPVARPLSPEAQAQRDLLAEITAAKRAAFMRGQK